jgi:hypothetical protein
LAVALPLHAQITSHWTFEEHQLPIKEGGRMNSIAVNPANGSEMLVASETGGLFKSVDGGLHWTHIDSLPVIFTQSIAYLPSGAVLVSAKEDFRRTNGGGVWRGENGPNGGYIWTQTLAHTFTGARLSAYELSVQPGTGAVFVGTSHGVFKSMDEGVHWSVDFAPGAPDEPAIISVLATEDLVYFGGPSGVWVVFGAVVHVYNTVGAVREMHAFAWWRERDRVFMVNSEGALRVHPSVGNGWEQLLSAPSAGRCDGIPFIKAVQRPFEGRDVLFLYLSDRCGLYTLAHVVTEPLPIHATWRLADVDEDEPRDLAFAGGEPVLLGTTAGLHHRPFGGTAWRLVGGGRDGGYNALQINEVKGQFLGTNARPDLYIGTQDNKVWAWRLLPNVPLRSYGGEGHFIELPRQAAPFSTCKVAFVADQQRKRSEELFDGVEDWDNAPGDDGAPALIRQGQYVQQVRPTAIFRDGLALTRDCGKGWEQFANFDQEPLDLPKLARAGNPDDPASTDVVYQPYRSPGGKNLLMRIDRPVSATSGVVPHYSLMTDFGSLGINPTMFAWYQVYAVDSGDPRHLIAADVADGVMRESINSGDQWTKMTGFTAQVLGTDFNFRAALNGPAVGEIFPFVTAVSFSPTNPQLVLAGTSQAGIFASSDNGKTWNKIPDSERVTYVTSFYWDTNNTVFVSTYGRGLWKLRNRPVAAPFDDFCGSCEVVSNDSSPGRPPFDGSVLAFDGRILGVRTSDKQLREVFVTPGTSVVFTGDPNDPQEDIAITASDGRDKFEPLPKGPDGWIAAGVVFTKGDEPTGAAFAKTEMSLLPPPSGQEVKDSTESPTKGLPYIRLTASASRGVATAVPQEVFQLSATDFSAGASYEVLIDGAPIKGTVTADGKGSFATKITAPSQTGYHRVAVRMAGDETEIDSSMFLVKY